jgi:hypothetical protein
MGAWPRLATVCAMVLTPPPPHEIKHALGNQTSRSYIRWAWFSHMQETNQSLKTKSVPTAGTFLNSNMYRHNVCKLVDTCANCRVMKLPK